MRIRIVHRLRERRGSGALGAAASEKRVAKYNASPGMVGSSRAWDWLGAVATGAVREHGNILLASSPALILQFDDWI